MKKIIIGAVTVICIVVLGLAIGNRPAKYSVDATYLVANSYMDAFNLSESSRSNMYLVGLDGSGNEVSKSKYKSNTADLNQFYYDVDGTLQLMMRSGKLDINEETREIIEELDSGTDGKGNYIDPSNGLKNFTNTAGGDFYDAGYLEDIDMYFQLINAGINSEEVISKFDRAENNPHIVDGFTIRLYGDDSNGVEYPVCWGAQSVTYEKQLNRLNFLCPDEDNSRIGISYLDLEDPKVEDYIFTSEVEREDEFDLMLDEGIEAYITSDKTLFIDEEGYLNIFEESIMENQNLESNSIRREKISDQPFRKLMSFNPNYSEDKIAFGAVNEDLSISAFYIDINTEEVERIDFDYKVGKENRNTDSDSVPSIYFGEDYYIVTEGIEVGGGTNLYQFTEFDSEGNEVNQFTHDFEYTHASSIIKIK